MAAKDIFGGPSWEEQLDADPELRARVDKQRARIAKQPSAADVVRRRDRRISKAVHEVRRRPMADTAQRCPLVATIPLCGGGSSFSVWFLPD